MALRILPLVLATICTTLALSVPVNETTYQLLPDIPNCHDSSGRIESFDCQTVILELENTYPPRSPHGAKWLLSRMKNPPYYLDNLIPCPLSLPKGEQKGHCRLIIDFRPPSGQETAPAALDQIAEWAFKLEDRCAVHGKAGIYWHSSSDSSKPDYYVKLDGVQAADDRQILNVAESPKELKVAQVD